MKDVVFWRYDLPSVNREGWAVVVMCSDGYFSTVSDWGNYAYWWSGHGTRDFRAFVADCDGDYIRCKLDPSKVLDYERTRDRCRRAVCEARRRPARGPHAYTLDTETAREAWERADGFINEIELNDWFNDYARYLDDYTDLAVYKTPPGIRGFIEKVLPRLQAAIKAELTRECTP